MPAHDSTRLREAFPTLKPREAIRALRFVLDWEDPREAADLARSRPESPAILDIGAEALLVADKPEDALLVLDRRESLGTSSVPLGLRARALAALGRVDDARALVADAKVPSEHLRRTLLGEALLAAGEAADARAAFEAALQEQPLNRRALAGAVDASAALNDLVTASAYAARLLDAAGEEEGPLAPRYLKRLRDFYARAGDKNRVDDADRALAARRAQDEAALAALLDGEPAAAPSPRPPKPRAAPAPPQPAAAPVPVVVHVSDAPPVADAEVADAAKLLQRHFGFGELRPAQGEVLARALRGESLLAVMPTGGGKSVCYQLPAMTSKGVTLVVSPLIALMKDQIDGLPAPMRLVSCAITSALPPGEGRRLTRDIQQGKFRLVYAAPERLRNASFLDAIRRAGVARLVVDEAHCVSVWGHDFRPDYLAIGDAHAKLGRPQLLAFTATAPPRVRADIIQRLGDLAFVQASVARPNLRLEAILAKNADEKLAHLVHLAKETPGPGVVYASSRAKCEQIAAALAAAGVRADYYHAGVPDRAARQEAFMRGDIEVLVATVAFGMGIDKADIRFVFHHDPASSLESYYQEAGRAGRDGQPARCVVLATPADAGTLKTRARQDLPKRDLVERVWGIITAGARGNYASMDPDLLDSLDDSDVKARVALGVLAETGAVERLADVPRQIFVGRAKGALAEFASRQVTVFDLAPALGVPPESVEERLLELEESGDVHVSMSGRDMLLKLDPTKAGAVAGVLERYSARAEERGKEIMDYVRAARCRHAHIRRYFGEDAPDTCGNCDLCLGVTHELAEEARPDDDAARRAVLSALAEVRRIGESNLVSMLRGDPRASDWTTNKQAYGTLAHRSGSVVKNVVASLLQGGYVERETMEHGGVVVRLTQKGYDVLGSDAPLDVPESAAAAPPARSDHKEGLDEDAQKRFDALREWRFQLAKEAGVPPYVVFADKTVRAIAEADPKNPEELLKVKGIGPAKLEQFGEDVLRILADLRT